MPGAVSDSYGGPRECACGHFRDLHADGRKCSACPCGVFMRHVDDFIDDPASDPYARKWLGLFRRPAIDRIREPNPDKLFATYDGRRYRVVGCSQMGDVWLGWDFSRENGYQLRVDVDKLSDWSATP